MLKIKHSENIYTIKDPMPVYTNGGQQDYTQNGTLELLQFEVYYNEYCLVKILSLDEVSDHFAHHVQKEALSF